MAMEIASYAAPDYSGSPFPIRTDLSANHRAALAHIAEPGTWWSGAERLAIAREARAARDCALCRARKAAISPFAVDGQHEGPLQLAAPVVDVIHRIVTDPGRLSRGWYEGVMKEGALDAPHYVELVSVAVVIHALDVFARALSLEPAPLPAPTPGRPSRALPPSARVEAAWVPQIPESEAGGREWRELYGEAEFVPQIGRALSLVPDEVRFLRALSEAHYMALEQVSDVAYVNPDRPLDRMQLELVASRVSAINECFY